MTLPLICWAKVPSDGTANAHLTLRPLVGSLSRERLRTEGAPMALLFVCSCRRLVKAKGSALFGWGGRVPLPFPLALEGQGGGNGGGGAGCAVSARCLCVSVCAFGDVAGYGAEGFEHFIGAFHAGGGFDAAVEVETVGVTASQDFGDVFGVDAAGENPGVGEVKLVELFERYAFSRAALAGVAAVEQVVGAVRRPGVYVALQSLGAVVLRRPENADDALRADGVGVGRALLPVKLGKVKARFFHGALDFLGVLADKDTDAPHVRRRHGGRSLGRDAARAFAVEDEADQLGPVGGGTVDGGRVRLSAGFDEGGAVCGGGHGCAVVWGGVWG